MSALLAIAVDAPLRRLFDYRAPPGVDPAALLPGVRLWVPFGRRRVIGVLVGRRDTSDLPASKLKAAISVVDESPALDAPLLELLTWAADYYRHPVGEVIAAALPVPLRNGESMLELADRWSLSAAARTASLPPLSARATSLRAIVDHLAGRDSADEASLATVSARWRDHVRELESRGWVLKLRVAEPPRSGRGGTGQQSDSRGATWPVPPRPLRREVPTGPVPEPTSAQRAAIDAIVAAQGRSASFLLHGVTGSGKTEVYLRAIEAVVARGEQALVLVPEIALTPQLVSRFAARFDTPLAVLHSSLTDQERLRAWRLARSGDAPVVIGTRSAVFAPLSKPGLIVVDEEHDASYKQQEGFRYSARDLALARAQRLGVPAVLGSATPSLESLERARSGKSVLLELPDRTGGAAQPRLQLVDLRRHGATQGIATPTVLAIGRHLEAGGQVLVYLNRRGYAPSLFCPACGWVAPCPRCDARLTVHQREHRLHCHHCGTDQPVPEACPNCSEPVRPVGQGTERVEETLSRLFPGVPLARIDRDAVRRRGELEAALDRVTRGEVRLLVGTQMLAKGHHFPDVTLVVVLNADQGLFGTDFRASERLAQSVIQVAGRAGRAEKPGEVLVQTEYPEHPLLARLVEGGYDAYAAAALDERRQARWPPYARIAVLRAEAARREVPLAFLDRARELALPLAGSQVEVLGPASAPMERRAGHYRGQLLLHAATHAPLQRLFAAWLPALEALPEARRVRWSLDVDPLELF